jgi:hypothetical protein
MAFTSKNNAEDLMNWKKEEQAGTIVEDTPIPDRMPLPTKLSRPMVTPRLYKFPVKKLELLEADTGKIKELWEMFGLTK